MMELSIVCWDDKYAEDFKKLSLEWLEKYVKVEPRDVEMFEHPHEAVLDRGGMIWFAVSDGKAVGTVGISQEDGEWELIKLAVTESFQGQGIGRKLVDTALSYAREIGVKKLLLFSNSALVSALHLYRQYGFRDVPVTGPAYETADVKMELELS